MVVVERGIDGCGGFVGGGVGVFVKRRKCRGRAVVGFLMLSLSLSLMWWLW